MSPEKKSWKSEGKPRIWTLSCFNFHNTGFLGSPVPTERHGNCFCLTFNSKSPSDDANIDAANSTIRLQAHLNPLKKSYLGRLVKFIPVILLCVPLRLFFFFKIAVLSVLRNSISLSLWSDCTFKLNKTTSLCTNLG